MSRAQRTKLCYPPPRQPLPLPSPLADYTLACWNCVIANQINGRDVIAAICIVLPKVFGPSRNVRDVVEGGGGVALGEAIVNATNECIRFETTECHKTMYTWMGGKRERERTFVE